MARAAINITLGKPLGSVSVASVPDIASVVADTAVLVADGASPTQAHVTTLNGHVGPLNAAVTGDITITWDIAKVTTVNDLKNAFAAAIVAAQGGLGGLT